MLLRLAASIAGGGMDCGLAPQVSNAAPRDAVTFVRLVLLFPTMCGTSPTHTPFVLANVLKESKGIYVAHDPVKPTNKF